MSQHSCGMTLLPPTPRIGSSISRTSRLSSTVGQRQDATRMVRVRTLYGLVLTMRTVVQTDYLNFWLSEKKDYHGGPPTGFKPGEPVTGHYTQIVWNTTKSVGCGIAVSPPEIHNGDIMACRFYPPGNYPRPPY